METLILLIVAALIFCLVWWLISLLPLPAPVPPAIKTLLYVLLIIVAVWWLYTRFLA